MTINWQAHRENIALHEGDFIFTATNETGPIQPGTTAEIVWENGVTWPGVVDGDTVSWRVESEDCTPEIIPKNTAFVVMVSYLNASTETTDDYPWIRGFAIRDDRK